MNPIAVDEQVSSRPFWLRPKWVFGHLLCLFLIVLFVNLGFWQLRRLHGKRVRNDLIHAREQATPTSVEDALRAGATGAVYRRVRADGHWDAADTILVRSRSLNQQPGYDVLTPLVIGDQAVVVNRGWVGIGSGGEPAILQRVRPVEGRRATVEGLLLASERRGSFGPRDPVAGRLSVVNRIDIPRLQQQTTERLLPVYLQLTRVTPPTDNVLQAVPLPATDEGPHLSYAIQWFIFATVGAVGWPILLRRSARDAAQSRS